MDDDAALRVVMDWKEVNTIKTLRAENERLNEELKLWKGHAKLPVRGQYYTAPGWLMENHGAIIFSYEVFLRYDGAEWISYKRADQTFRRYVHLFRAPTPYTPDECITFAFETYVLHYLCEVQWDTHILSKNFFMDRPPLYVDKDDKIRYYLGHTEHGSTVS